MVTSSSSRHRPSRGGSNRTRAGAAGLVFALSFLLTAPPALAECPPTDTTCLAETTEAATDTATDTTETVVDTTTGTVDEAEAVVDETTAVVEETIQDPEGAVEDLEETAGQAVAGAIGTVEDLLGIGPGPDPGPDPEPGSGSGGTGSGGVGDEPTPGNGSTGGGGSTGPGADTSGNDRDPGTPFGRGPLIDAPAVGGPSFVPSGEEFTIPPRPLFDRIVGAAIGAAKRLAFPLALALIVIGFVMVQNRIDRKDPKLALAPIAPDVLRFA